MVASVFGKTRPINFIFIIIFLIFFFFGVHFFLLKTSSDILSLLKLLGILILILGSVFLTNFISKKNGLTRDNTYAALLFVLILSFFPYTFSNIEIIISNVFILLAIRRIISLKSYIQIKLKLFDASLWICLATIFYEWAILFFFLVFVAILHYGLKDIRNWLIPLVAIITVCIFAVTFFYLTNQLDKLSGILDFKIELHIEKYLDLRYLIPFLYILSVGVLATFSYFANIKSKLSEEQSSILLVIVAFLVSLFISLLSNNERTSEFIFMGFPLAIVMTNYMELIKKWWYKEFLLWTFIILPFVVLML